MLFLQILKYLRESACELLGNITEAVISVPAKFSGAQRKATIDAAQLAGFTEVNLISEPVAAAIHYTNKNLDGETNGKLLVFDFGGGTLDVSIIEVHINYFTSYYANYTSYIKLSKLHIHWVKILRLMAGLHPTGLAQRQMPLLQPSGFYRQKLKINHSSRSPA